MAELEIKHDPIGQKFYAEIGKQEALLAYTQINQILDVHLVYVPEELRERGIAERLALAAFAYAEKKGFKIVSSCDYLANGFLPKHGELKHLVAESEF